MRKYFLAGMAIGLGMLSFPAFSATLITSDTTQSGVTLHFGPQTYSDKLKNNASPDGNPVTLKAKDSGTLYDYSTTDAINLHTSGNNGNGFSTVTAATGPGFSNLTIDPQGSASFDAIAFDIFPLSTEGQKGAWYGDISIYIDGMVSPVTFANVEFNKNSSKFWIDNSSDLHFSKLVFDNISFDGDKPKKGDDPAPVLTDYQSIREVSVIPTTAVPEPATWAMMIAGFGLTGVAMRTRRRRVATVAA